MLTNSTIFYLVSNKDGSISQIQGIETLQSAIRGGLNVGDFEVTINEEEAEAASEKWKLLVKMTDFLTEMTTEQAKLCYELWCRTIRHNPMLNG